MDSYCLLGTCCAKDNFGIKSGRASITKILEGPVFRRTCEKRMFGPVISPRPQYPKQWTRMERTCEMTGAMNGFRNLQKWTPPSRHHRQREKALDALRTADVQGASAAPSLASGIRVVQMAAALARPMAQQRHAHIRACDEQSSNAACPWGTGAEAQEDP